MTEALVDDYEAPASAQPEPRRERFRLLGHLSHIASLLRLSKLASSATVVSQAEEATVQHPKEREGKRRSKAPRKYPADVAPDYFYWLEHDRNAPTTSWRVGTRESFPPPGTDVVTVADLNDKANLDDEPREVLDEITKHL